VDWANNAQELPAHAGSVRLLNNTPHITLEHFYMVGGGVQDGGYNHTFDTFCGNLVIWVLRFQDHLPSVHVVSSHHPGD
jgi:hypothetical protein